MLKPLESYNVPPLDKKGESEGSMSVKSYFEFAKALDSFFLCAWRSITSAVREILLVHKLDLKADKVYFYTVRDALKREPTEAN